MKTINTEFQNELIEYLSSIGNQDFNPNRRHYFVEQLRPKRVRRKVENNLEVAVDVAA